MNEENAVPDERVATRDVFGRGVGCRSGNAGVIRLSELTGKQNRSVQEIHKPDSVRIGLYGTAASRQ